MYRLWNVCEVCKYKLFICHKKTIDFAWKNTWENVRRIWGKSWVSFFPMQKNSFLHFFSKFSIHFLKYIFSLTHFFVSHRLVRFLSAFLLCNCSIQLAYLFSALFPHLQIIKLQLFNNNKYHWQANVNSSRDAFASLNSSINNRNSSTINIDLIT